MQHSTEFNEVVKAIAAARQDMGKVFKDGYNETQRYKFASFESFMDAADEALVKHGLIVITSADSFLPCERAPTKTGTNQYGCYITLSLRVIHVESCQWYEIVSYGDGQDFGDKAIYKANTGSRKYGYAMLFGLATTDDPEADKKTPGDKDADVAKPPRTRTTTKAKDAPTADSETQAKIHTDLMDQLECAKTLGALKTVGSAIARETRLTKKDTDSLRGIYEQRAITIKEPEKGAVNV